MRLDPLNKGVLEGIWIVTLTAGFLFALLTVAPHPSPELLRDIASLGGALVLAYVVEMTWLVQVKKRDEKFVGLATALGVAGLAGTFLMLLLAAHRQAGHGNVLDTIGFSWALASLILLGLIVTIHPLLVYRLSGNDSEEVDQPS